MTTATARSQHWSKSGALRLLIVILLFELVAWAMIRASAGLSYDLWLLAAGATALLTMIAFCIASLVRSRFRFGLRALLFGMLVVGGGLGWIGMFLESTRQQRRVLRNLEQFDLRVDYENHAAPGIETLLGSEYFQRVTGLGIDCDLTTSEDLVKITELASLKSLSLWGDGVTDADIVRFRTLGDLELLSVHSSRVTGSALDEIRRLSHLEHLAIGRAQQVG